MKKSLGWRREPARHALAAKGIETGTTAQKRTGRRALALPPKAMRSGTPVIQDELKGSAVDKVLADALREGGDRSGAIQLLEDDKWLDGEAGKIAGQEASGFMQRAALKQEILRTVRKNPPVFDEEVD